jgi:outer membrane protein OmpA-like peptidoglycan-associated protein
VEFLTVNPTVHIEISGHTDNVGNDQLNQTLSENRAKAVYQYLISNQISPARLVYKGYGKTQPIALNTTEEGRQKNRRTEFMITAR